MLKWLVEYDDKAVPLDLVHVDELRAVIDPLRAEITAVLSDIAEDSGEIEVVFVVADDGSLSLAFRGSSALVNWARDKLGPERRIGSLLC